MNRAGRASDGNEERHRQRDRDAATAQAHAAHTAPCATFVERHARYDCCCACWTNTKPASPCLRCVPSKYRHEKLAAIPVPEALAKVSRSPMAASRAARRVAPNQPLNPTALHAHTPVRNYPRRRACRFHAHIVHQFVAPATRARGLRRTTRERDTRQARMIVPTLRTEEGPGKHALRD